MTGSFSSSLAVSSGRIAALVALLSVVPAALAVTIPTSELSATRHWANTNIDRNNSRIWNFSVEDGFTVEDIVGSFVLKAGQGTSEPIMFSLFGRGDATDALLATTSVAAGTVGRSFGKGKSVHFLLSDVNIGAGNYSLKLYSSAADGGRYQWFFKGAGNDLTANGGALQAVQVEAQSISVPEPGTLALLGLGLAGLGLGRRRKSA